MVQFSQSMQNIAENPLQSWIKLVLAEITQWTSWKTADGWKARRKKDQQKNQKKTLGILTHE